MTHKPIYYRRPWTVCASLALETTNICLHIIKKNSQPAVWNCLILSQRINTAASDEQVWFIRWPWNLSTRPYHASLSESMLAYTSLQLLSLSLLAINLYQQFCQRERNRWPQSNINEKVSFFYPVLMSLACTRGESVCKAWERVVAGGCRPMFLLQCLCWETWVSDWDRFIILSLSPMKSLHGA